MGTETKAFIKLEVKPEYVPAFQEIIDAKYHDEPCKFPWKHFIGMNTPGFLNSQNASWFLRHRHAKLDGNTFLFASPAYKNYDGELDWFKVAVAEMITHGESISWDDVNDVLLIDEFRGSWSGEHKTLDDYSIVHTIEADALKNWFGVEEE